MTSPHTREPGRTVVGRGDFRYEVRAGWEQLPPGWGFVEVAGVATDSEARLYVFNRGEHPVIVFARDGRFLGSWGEGDFRRPHGICVAPDDTVYCTDDADHTVRQYTREGRLLRTLGTSGRPSDTGAVGNDYRTVQRAGPPFNFPTNLAVAPDGDLFISDGYGNACVHRFAPDGRLRASWGAPGGGKGQFQVPHGIAVDQGGTVYVADRENSRVQLFTADGTYRGEWTDVARPCQVFVDGLGAVYVAELGLRAGRWPWMAPPEAGAVGGRMSVFDRDGRLQARWGGGENPTAPGDFFAPHDVCVDAHGDVYVGEVVMSAGGRRGLVPADCHALQKFVRLK